MLEEKLRHAACRSHVGSLLGGEERIDCCEVNSSCPRMYLIANREEPLLHIKYRVSRTWDKLQLKVNKNP